MCYPFNTSFGSSLRRWLSVSLFCGLPLSAVKVDLSDDVSRFRLGNFPGAEAVDYDDSFWQRVSIPHTWNALDAQDGKHRVEVVHSSGYRRGSAWYRQTYRQTVVNPEVGAKAVATAHFGDTTVEDTLTWNISAEKSPRFATLKFDDLMPQEGGGGVTEIEQRVYAMLMAQNIPHAWGVCRLWRDDDPEYYAWLKARDSEGIEIWHHGNNHDRIQGESWEFRNRDAESQRRNLRFTQDEIYRKTGITLRTFGAPYNRTDEITGEALNELEALQIMYFSHGSPNFDGMVLNDRVNLEARTGVVADLEAFKESYRAREDAEIIVLQAHPVYWDPERDMENFQAILDFLKAEGREFITPWSYCQRIQAR